MSIKFQADANLNPNIWHGLRIREPGIDFRGYVGVISDGLPDAEVLELAAADERILVTHDVRTMLISRRDSPGLLVIPSSRSLGDTIEGLHSVWEDSHPDEFKNQVVSLPRP